MTTGHLDATRLAEHAEGLLPPDEAAAVDAHLQRCEACQAAAAELASVSAALADAPRTLPIPADVAARIDQAIAAEARPEPAAVPVVQLSWFRRRAPQLLAAAATVGVLGFAGWVVTTSGGGGDDEAATDAATLTEENERSSDDDAAAEEEGGDEAPAAPLDAEDGEASIAAPKLAAEIRAVVSRDRTEGAERAEDTCGLPLAEELGLELVGTAATETTGETAVLVVVQSDDPAFAHGWVVPGCESTAEDALTELTVELD